MYQGGIKGCQWVSMGVKGYKDASKSIKGDQEVSRVSKVSRVSRSQRVSMALMVYKLYSDMGATCLEQIRDMFWTYLGHFKDLFGIC